MYPAGQHRSPLPVPVGALVGDELFATGDLVGEEVERTGDLVGDGVDFTGEEVGPLVDEGVGCGA